MTVVCVCGSRATFYEYDCDVSPQPKDRCITKALKRCVAPNYVTIPERYTSIFHIVSTVLGFDSVQYMIPCLEMLRIIHSPMTFGLQLQSTTFASSVTNSEGSHPNERGTGLATKSCALAFKMGN